jgi:hypothetical protein
MNEGMNDERRGGGAAGETQDQATIILLNTLALVEPTGLDAAYDTVAANSCGCESCKLI